MKKWFLALNIETKISFFCLMGVIVCLPGVYRSFLEARALSAFFAGLGTGIQICNLFRMWSDSRMNNLREKHRPKEWWEKEVS